MRRHQHAKPTLTAFDFVLPRKPSSLTKHAAHHRIKRYNMADNVSLLSRRYFDAGSSLGQALPKYSRARQLECSRIIFVIISACCLRRRRRKVDAECKRHARRSPFAAIRFDASRIRQADAAIMAR